VEIAILLKKYNNNKKGTRGYVDDRSGCFVFNGFKVSRELVIDSPEYFKIENKCPVDLDGGGRHG